MYSFAAALFASAASALSNEKVTSAASMGVTQNATAAAIASTVSLVQEAIAPSAEHGAKAFQFNTLQLALLSVGGVLSIAIVGFVMYMCLRRQDSEKEDEFDDDDLVADGRLHGGAGVGADGQIQYAYLDVLLSVIAFMAASAGMAIANKMAVTALGLPMLLVGIQCASTLLILIPAYKTINLGSWRDKVRWFPVSLLFVGMLGTSMVAYQLCSLGTVVVIRMISPLLGLLVEASFNRAKFIASAHTFMSLGVIMAGVILYAIFQKGISGEVLGIFFMIANMFVATAERLCQRYLMAENPVDMSDTGLMLYNNTVCMLAMPLLMFVFNEWSNVDNFVKVTGPGWGFIIWSCLCGACISYTAFRAQRRISATSFLVVVNMNKFVVVGYGILVLGEAYKPLAAIGCALALLGGAYYSWDRSELKKRTKAVAASAAAEDNGAEESVALLGDKNKGRGASTAKTA